MGFTRTQLDFGRIQPNQFSIVEVKPAGRKASSALQEAVHSGYKVKAMGDGRKWNCCLCPLHSKSRNVNVKLLKVLNSDNQNFNRDDELYSAEPL